MMAAPRIFGLPPFASLVLVSDARAAESVPWNAACRQRGDSFVVDGVTHGKVAAFERFLESAGYDPVEVGAADMPVIVIDRDYRCPRRARVVLQAGCAYGAPGYIARLAWRLARLEARNFLQLAHADLDGPADGAQAEIEDLRRRYLEAVTERIRVVYFPADRSVEIHGRHVCRGVPALLLRECVRVAQNEGRTSFSYRELKRLPALVSHPKNTGFETRLGRLRAALAAADCGLTIEPERPGRFRLVSKGGLELEERSR
jgi:hypothetical protein